MATLIDSTSDYINTTVTDTDRIDAAILAASDGIERFCKRTFAVTSHDEHYRTGRNGLILTDSFPVLAISRVFFSTADALLIANDGSATSASFNTDATALNLVHTLDGTTTTNALTYAANATVAAMATAVDAVAVGWNGTATAAYSGYPSADFVEGQYKPAGTGTSGNYADMWVESENSEFDVELDKGIIQTPLGTGVKVRLIYSAGFATIPTPIQQVCGNLVNFLLDQKSGAIQSERLGDYSYSLVQQAMDRMPLMDKQLLELFRDRR